MTQTELMTLLTQTGLPVSYHSFPKPQSLPCIVFIRDQQRAAGSDYANELKQESYLIELYSEHKYPAGEALIEKLLDQAGIKYTAYETKIEDVCRIAYEIEFYYKK